MFERHLGAILSYSDIVLDGRRQESPLRHTVQLQSLKLHR